MIRLVVGLALLPTAVLTAAAAVRMLAALAWQRHAWPFAVGALCGLGLWLLGVAAPRRGWTQAARFVYVLGHELTHALAAWALGGRVHALKVGAEGGHVDLSRGGVFVCLAPYCLPLYALLVIAGFRLLLWVRPHAELGAFLFLLGLTLSGHWLMTAECLWGRRQPDLACAGGRLFSLAVIGLSNGFVLMFLAKAFFPRSVGLWASLSQVARLSAGFWLWNYGWLKALLGPIGKGYPA
ncbi:MAG: hypothetical protein PHF00_09120 [Elusimicrobia bacterium]|nr:hypothetical protein [Elusimicrobiota bacterium]